MYARGNVIEATLVKEQKQDMCMVTDASGKRDWRDWRAQNEGKM